MANQRSPLLKERGWVLALSAVTLLAFGLRWYYVATAQVLDPVRGDAVQYFSYAWNLVHHGVFSHVEPGSMTVIPDSYRDPGYPLFLAMWMKGFGTGGTWYAVVLLVQALLGALTVLFAMLLGRYWLPATWVLGAGIVMALWPHSVTINSFLLSETLFGCLATLAMLLLAHAIRRGSTSWAVAAGFMFSAAALTNAVLLPFGLLLALLLAWRRMVPRRLWLALAIAAVVLPGAWMVRNSQLPAQAASVTSTDRALQNLVQGSWPAYQAAYILATIYHDPHAQQVLASITHEYQLLRTSPAKGADVILHRLGKHPGRYLAWYVFQKPRLLWGWNIRVGQGDIYVFQTRHSPFATQAVLRAWEWLCHAGNGLLAALALLGVILALLGFRRDARDDLQGAGMAPVAVGALLIFVTGVYTLFQADPRYAIPFRALEILMVASACRFIWTRAIAAVHSRRAKVASPGTPASA